MSETVVFSQLSRKFIDENDATPDQAQQVVYYSLAIGHHRRLPHPHHPPTSPRCHTHPTFITPSPTRNYTHHPVAPL